MQKGRYMEIERKWLVLVENMEKIIKTAKMYQIEQAYLLVDDKKEIRIRKKNDEYFLTKKTSGNLSRGEFETPIDADIYNFLMNQAIGNVITKKRYIIPYESYTIELDIFENIDLVLAEVEFESEEEARAFIPPEWFGRDVTQDKRFKNKYLALATKLNVD